MESSAQLIVRLAVGYANAGIVEIQPNKGWTNKAFEADMRGIGWLPGDEWCADSVILIYKKAYSLKAAIWAVARRLLSANAQLTGRNFHSDKVWPTGMIPRLGAIGIYQSGNSLVYGHADIVTWVSADKKTYRSAAGNTSSTTHPEIRNGWTYAEHTHVVGQAHSVTGLNLLRFVYPIESYSPLIY